MTFKPEKSVDIIFSKSNLGNIFSTPNLSTKLNGKTIPLKRVHKHLGVLLDENLSFTPHCREVILKIKN